MTNSLFKVGFLFLVFVGVSGCSNFLDEAPDDRLDLDSLDKAAKVVAKAYSQGSYVFTDMYTDLAGPVALPNAEGDVINAGGNVIEEYHLQIYKWEDVENIFEESPTFYWFNAYEAIAHANEVLTVIDGLGGDAERRNAIKGEALLTRAYHHFMLVNLFGMHYGATSSSDLGVPYVTKPEVEFLPEYKRNTVQEVYDLVEKDLLSGISLVRDKYYTGTKKYHFTKKAALAFASRFYLWKRDYQKCVTYSNQFLGGNPGGLLKDYTAISASGYNDFAEQYGDPANDSNVLVMQQFTAYTRRGNGFRLNDSDINRLFLNPFISLSTPEFVEDQRLSGFLWGGGSQARFLPRLREYFFREDLSSNTGQPYYISQELKSEEVLLNRAEAYALQDITSNALVDMNILSQNRYGRVFSDTELLKTHYNETTDKDALIALILDERKKEFWDHGLRWFDVKRHGISISHLLPLSFGGDTMTLQPNDLRTALQIPNSALNFGLQPNPR